MQRHAHALPPARRRHPPRSSHAPTTATPRPDDAQLIERLRAGDEQAFSVLLDRHCNALLRLAMSFVTTRAAAEEVVQETWLAVFKGLARFEGRASLKTWIFRILINRAITRRARDARCVPLSALGREEASHDAAVDPNGLLEHTPANGPNHGAYRESPEHTLTRKQTREQIDRALNELPKRQRAVVTLRDVQGWSSKDVCRELQLSEANQRVLLHRGRVKLRALLGQHLGAALA